MVKLTIDSRLKGRFDEYDSYHRHPMNQRLHYFGVPLIMLGLLGLLSQLKAGARVDGGLILWGVALVYYFWIARRLGLMFSGLAFLFYLAGRELAVSINVAAFLVGWVIQAMGHAKFEKTSPAFLKNIEHLLVGPLWLFAKLFRIPNSSSGRSS